MDNWSDNRLTVIGARRLVQRFQQSTWAKALGANHCELLENSPRRFSCQFEAGNPPPESLMRLSRHWPTLTFLLDYEVPAKRVKGLAKAKAGELVDHRLTY
jgi:hypothetical protein